MSENKLYEHLNKTIAMDTAKIFTNILQIIMAFPKWINFWLEGIVLAFIPLSWRQKDVTGQIVLITGAGNGIGREIAKQFASRRCRLVLWDVDMAGLEETSSQLDSSSVSVTLYTVDVSDRVAVYDAAEKVKENVGKVDILVNNAGIVGANRFLDIPDEDLCKIMNINALAHFWTVKAFLPAMLAQNHGHIVTIASIAGLNGIAYIVDYSTSKFAAVGFNESLAQEIRMAGKDGIHFTVVCPWFTNTRICQALTSPMFIPILDVVDVVETIVMSVLANKRQVIIPKSLNVGIMMKSMMPAKCTDLMNDVLGGNQAGKDLVGSLKQE